jgi:hypothetical protein
MIKVLVTEPMLEAASEMASKVGRLQHSITNGKGTLAGCLTELAAVSVFDGAVLEDRLPHLYEYDVIWRNQKQEWKAKRCTSPPQAGYEGSVASYNPNQQCDVYAFSRVLFQDRRYSKPEAVFLIGYISKSAFHTLAVPHYKGEGDSNVIVEPSGVRRQFTFTADCYNIFYHELQEFPPELTNWAA